MGGGREPAEVSGVVETTHPPLAVHADKMRQRTIVGAAERIGRTGHCLHDCRDDTAVHDTEHPFAAVGLLDSVECCHAPGGELRCGLGTRDVAPLALFNRAQVPRVSERSMNSGQAAFPFAQEHFAKLGFKPRFEAEPLANGRRGLVGADECGDVDGVNVFVDKTFRSEPGL